MTLDQITELLGAGVGQFSPGAFYDAAMDWLIVLTEDVGYVAQSLRHGDIEVLWHPHEPRIVGIKIWDISKHAGGMGILRRAGLLPTP